MGHLLERHKPSEAREAYIDVITNKYINNFTRFHRCNTCGTVKKDFNAIHFHVEEHREKNKNV